MHATLWPTLSICLSVRPCWSVGHTLLFRRYGWFLRYCSRPNAWVSFYHHCPCPPARDFGSCIRPCLELNGWVWRRGHTALSARIQVKIHSTVGFFVVCHSLRVTLTKTNNYKILSRALFEKYEKNINFTFVLNEEFFNSSRPLFWWQICNPDVISFHLIGRTICLHKKMKISIFKPPLQL